MAPISRVYNGEDPFIFISYSHRDKRRVHAIAEQLISEGYRVWFDGGIETAARFPDVIAEHVEKCAVFIVFVSKESMTSDFVIAECHYALNLKKRMCVVYLEDERECGIPAGLRMFFSSTQSVSIESSNFDVLLRAPLKECRGDGTTSPKPAAEPVRKKGAEQPETPAGNGVLRFENGKLHCGDEEFDANVRRLDLRGKGITDISALVNMTKLNILVLSDNEITDISPLAKLTTLSTLNISGNKVSDISAVSELKLLWLILSGNPITDISPVLGLTKLTNLYVNKTGISQADKDKLKEALPKCSITF